MLSSVSSAAAQLAPAASAAVWTAAVLAAAVVLLVAAMWFRRWLLRRLDAPARTPALLTLQQVRSLHAAGLISDEEREALRASALAQAGPAAQRPRFDDERTLRAPPGVDLTGEPLPGAPSAGAPDKARPENPEGEEPG